MSLAEVMLEEMADHLQKKEARAWEQNKKEAAAVQCVVCGQVGPA